VRDGKSYQANKKKEKRKEFIKMWAGIILGAAALVWNIAKEF
jgi:hypothetical protein